MPVHHSLVIFLILYRFKFRIPRKDAIYLALITVLIFVLFLNASLFDFSGPIVMTDQPLYFFYSKMALDAMEEGRTANTYYSFTFGRERSYFTYQDFLIAFYSKVFNLDLAIAFRLFVFFSFFIVV